MPIIGEDDWYETFEDARGGPGVLHVETSGTGLAVAAYTVPGGSGIELRLSDSDARKLGDLIARRCPAGA